jgi:5-methylcytosine-specific restriction protein B
MDDLQRWLRAIERKGQAILYGPPGTGKTFVAEHLARHLVGGGDGLLEVVQFHPAYGYEDFIQGLRPTVDDASGALSFQLRPGRFLDFVRHAEEREGTSVLIIDEINRANLPRVLGELMYLLEYRGRSVPLAAGGTLRVPENVRILATMNTADRSIALVDHALRRRFAFLPLRPQLEVLEAFHAGKPGAPVVPGLTAVLRKLHVAIDDPHLHLGISYFLVDDLRADVEDVWRTEIEPYLEELFFDQPQVRDEFRWTAVRAQVLGGG